METLITWLYHLEQVLFGYAIYLGWLSMFAVLALNLKPESRLHLPLWIMAGVSPIAPIMHFSMNLILLIWMNGLYKISFPVQAMSIWGKLFAGGILITFLWLRFVPQGLNTAMGKVMRSSELERNRRTDVRDMHNYYPTAVHEYNPLQYVDYGKGIFLGVSEHDEPVHIKYKASTSIPHTQVIGTSGVGKGVFLGVMAAQFLECGEAVFFFDPKNDEWAAHVLYATAQRAGKPFYFINLNRPNGPQFNPFAGATEEEAFELFQAGFSLTEKGDASDFYGIADRREAGLTAKLMAEQNLNIAQVYTERRKVLQDKESGAEKFAGRLREMAETPSINALGNAGVDLEKVIAEGGCVYIVGSMRNDIVKTVQRILLVRLIQLAERRDRIAGGVRPVCIILDEVKYHLSRPALESLGAARDKGIHLVLAHQSLGDLRDCPKDLNPDAVVDAVVENCGLKLCYRLLNPVTAEWLAAMSGTIQVDDETRTVTKNIAQSETVLPERNIRQAERYFIDVNMLLNLPPAVGVLYGDGLPKFISIRPLQVEKNPLAVTVKIVAGTNAPSARDAISL